MIQLSGKKYLVTGAAGFVGSHLAEEIVKQGKKVVCLDNLTVGKKKNMGSWWDWKYCTFVNADVSNPANYQDHFKGIDVVFHEAASKCTVCRDNPFEDLVTNAWGPWCVFEAARMAGVKKIVHASTGSVNNGEPKSFYGVSKQAGESYLRAFKEYHPDFRYSVLRYYHVIGTRQDCSEKGGVVPIFIRQADCNEPITIHGDGLQVRHFTSVKDVVNANFAVAENENTDGQIFEVVSDVYMTIIDLAKTICRLMGKEENFVFEDARPGDLRRFAINGWKMRSLIDYNNDIESILQDIINWYVKVKPWPKKRPLLRVA